jgi:hypothetical protein
MPHILLFLPQRALRAQRLKGFLGGLSELRGSSFAFVRQGKIK